MPILTPSQDARRRRSSGEWDQLFASRAQRSAFDFGEPTARVFDDMLLRSVPFYAEIQRMVVELSGVFLKDGTCVYDLGCSTGTTLIHLLQRYGRRNVMFIGVDNSPAMLERVRAKLSQAKLGHRCELRQADITELAVENASVILLLLTLQFVRPLYRDTLIRRLYEGLVPNGCLLLVEKVLCHDSGLNQIFIDRYYDFKRRQGYSKLEIARKREALENILVPYRMQENFELLSRNGFAAREVFFRWYNFAGIIAVKREPPRSEALTERDGGAGGW